MLSRNGMEDVLAALRMELGSGPELDAPEGMWDRFVARLEAEPQEMTEASSGRVKIPVILPRLVPTS